MRWIERCSELGRRFQMFFSRRERFDLEIEEEMRLHRDLRARELRDDGANSKEAGYAAQRRFGNTLRLREEIHQAWGWTWLDRLILDLRYGVRRLRQSPGFATVAVLTLALGIGANTAIFSFMDSILLHSLPVPDPDSLVILKWHNKLIHVTPASNPEGHGTGGGTAPTVMHDADGWTHSDPKLGHVGGIFPFPAFELLQKNSSPFSILFAYCEAPNVNVIIKGQADIAKGEYVSGDYFRGLAIRSTAGRLITPDDDRRDAPTVAVVSMGFSQRYFGGPTNATGQKILVNNVPTTVVGVTPAEFFGVDPSGSPDLFLPLHANVMLEAANPFGAKAERYLDQNYYWIEMMARLRPGVSGAQAQAALEPLFHQWVEGTASTEQERANLPALLIQEGAGGLDDLRRQYSKPLYILMTLVGLILAVACANIASLLLARAAARRGEMALRLSLGAARLRLARQLLTESLLLAALGGVAGVLFALWGIRFLTLLLAKGQESFAVQADLNWRVLAVTALLSLLSGVLFSLAPVLQSIRADVGLGLRDLRPSETRSRSVLGLRQVLVVSQMALSFLLLVAAGLFVRTLSNLESVELGFNRENVLLFRLNARQGGHTGQDLASFYAGVQGRLQAMPGVRGASLSNSPLIGGDGTWSTNIRVSGKPVVGARFLTVGPAFFTTMQIPILLGREIDQHDQPKAEPVAVVNQLFATLAFGELNPIGRHLTFGGGQTPARDMGIIGVTKNARYGDVKDDLIPVVYVPYIQGAWPVDEMTYAVRAAGDPLAQVDAVRKIVHQADARVPVTNIRTQAAQIDQIMNQEITFAQLCTAFAILALVMACVGLYGATSYNVARRTSEIGIRMALGAQRSGVVWMVLREVSLLATLGLAIGLPAAFATSRLIKSFLFAMKPNDPLALTSAVVTLLGAALLAGYAPARRASRIDPMVALRHE